VAAEGAHPLTVDLLSHAEAGQFLTRRLGPDRVAADPRAADAVITGCARLPLALAIAAARAATRPDFPLAVVAGELHEARDGLDAFAGGDTSADVRAVFSWSYDALGTGGRRLFRLIGLHPGPDLSPAAAASLAGLPAGQVRGPLAELTRAHLAIEHSPGRYTCHDLLRTYATEQSRLDPEPDRRAATHRLLDHYLHTAQRAAALLDPHHDPIVTATPQPGVTPENLAGQAAALAWFGAEYPVLRAALDLAAGDGWDAHAWQLVCALAEFFDRQGRRDDWVRAQRIALEAARRLDDPRAQAVTHRGLARGQARLGNRDDARTHYRLAYDLFVRLDDHSGRADVHLGLAFLASGLGSHLNALEHARRALDLFGLAGNRYGRAVALNAVGWYQAQLGEYRQALTHCGQALAIQQELDDRSGQAGTWDSLGYAYENLGDHGEAAGCYRRAIELCRAVGDRHREADTLIRLAEVHAAAGRPHDADLAWRRALDTFEALGDPEAAGRVRAALRRRADPAAV
jgi:tetratricopeptide (TPR) repeat protein